MKYGLIGHPIEHSLSPALFKAGYDGKYPYDLIEEQDFEKAYQRFLAEYDGINVTSPFKETALLKADIVSDECRMIGATNLLSRLTQELRPTIQTTEVLSCCWKLSIRRIGLLTACYPPGRRVWGPLSGRGSGSGSVRRMEESDIGR